MIASIKSVKIPSWNDPRWNVISLQLVYILIGITFLGFNRFPLQIVIIISSACFLDMLFHYSLRKKEIIFPLSGAITGCGLSILANYSHGVFLPLVPVFFAIASKYLVTVDGRHVFNPALFGVVFALWYGEGMITPSPSYQWGGYATIGAFIATAAILLFMKKINRSVLVISFILLYFAQVGLRGYLTQDILPPHILFLGAIANPGFYLFTFFMITDPQTSPSSKWGQFFMALCIVVIDLVLHFKQSFSTFFFAGFYYFSARWVYLQIMSLLKYKPSLLSLLISKIRAFLYNGLFIGVLGVAAFLFYTKIIHPLHTIEPGFKLTEVSTAHSNLVSKPSNVLIEVDPRIQNIAKWILSVGDSIAITDVNNDGLQDIFLTNTIKSVEDRAALYLNQGNHVFKRFPLPYLTKKFSEPKTNGLPTGAVWFDLDNNGTQDLLILVSGGAPVLLKNTLTKSTINFTDVTKDYGLDFRTNSIAGNVLDVNQDGKLDIILASVVPPYLKDYDTPHEQNIFALPQPEYEGDRRMFNFMHRTWHNASNGGEKIMLLNHGDHFESISAEKSGLDGTRWSLVIGSGDFNRDGFPDLYFANDFGPDELFINQGNASFKSMKGYLPHHIGRDTYKSMNATVEDFDGNGQFDIYTSNVHHKLQAEGSQLWLNDGTLDTNGYQAFVDSATEYNTLNENRFGWGAAVGDLNLDGKLDIVQANGMTDNSFDPIYPGCPDYWYWNEKIALTGPDYHGYADNWADIRGRCIFPAEQNRAYINQGEYFIDVADKVGLTKLGTSRGVALADFDNSGVLDISYTDQYHPPSLYTNKVENANWLGLELEGDGKKCNRDAIGSIVEISYTEGSETIVQTRHIKAINGFSGQSEKRLLIGLGQTKDMPNITVNWCGSGQLEELSLGKNQYHKLKQK